MEWVEQVKLGRPKWLAEWPIITLVLLFIVALILVDGHLLTWAWMALLSAPISMLAALALFLLPGLALLRVLWHDELSAIQRWPLAIGISCAVLPLLLLLSEPIGLRWNPWLCWVFLLFCILVLIWPRRNQTWLVPWQQMLVWHLDRQHLLLIAITVVAILVRLYATHDLIVGMWGDSYHHTIIAQLLVDNGGLFSSWQPYVPLRTFTYHYGFHSNVAWFSWLSGQPVIQGLLIIGQIQSALVAPLAYVFARRLLKSNSAGLWAAVITGFVSTMPAYYANWGRYTQLAGQTILPITCVVWIALLEIATEQPVKRSRLLRLIALTVIVTVGLTLTHYRVAVFAACFVVSFGIYLLCIRVRSLHQFGWLVGTSLMTLILTLAVAAPWLIRLREGSILRVGNYLLSNNIGTDFINTLPTLNDIFALYAKPYLIGLALLGVVLCVWQRRWGGLVIVGWAGLIWLAANPYLLGLPGAGIISNFTVMIACYLILAPLAGATIESLCLSAANFMHIARPLELGQVLVGGALIIWGAGWQQHIITSQYQLFTPADAAAMEWIDRETPINARFFVNSFPAYGNTLYAGSDGGWWLPFISKRQSNLPPINYASEVGEQPEYQLAVNADNEAIVRYPISSTEAATALQKAGYTYLYNGPAASPSGEYINPSVLAQSPLYTLIYSKDGVTIWQVLAPH